MSCRARTDERKSAAASGPRDRSGGGVGVVAEGRGAGGGEFPQNALPRAPRQRGGLRYEGERGRCRVAHLVRVKLAGSSVARSPHRQPFSSGRKRQARASAGPRSSRAGKIAVAPSRIGLARGGGLLREGAMAAGERPVGDFPRLGRDGREAAADSCEPQTRAWQRGAEPPRAMRNGSRARPRARHGPFRRAPLGGNGFGGCRVLFSWVLVGVALFCVFVGRPFPLPLVADAIFLMCATARPFVEVTGPSAVVSRVGQSALAHAKQIQRTAATRNELR